VVSDDRRVLLHQLRAHVATISGYAQLARRRAHQGTDTADHEACLRYLDELQRQIARLVDFLNSLDIETPHDDRE
jgi:light-regulated signal transduction histidine kinase (bacteriophytochrome)